MTKRELERLLKAAGSIKALAEGLRVSSSTVRRWKKSGVPKRGDAREKLARYKVEQKAGKARKSSDLKKLRALRKKAEIAAKGAGIKLTRAKTRTRALQGQRTAGIEYTEAFEQEVSMGTIDDFARWARSHRKKFPMWQAVAIITQFSETEEFAFGTSPTMVDVMVADDEDKNKFIAEQVLPTSASENLREVISNMREELEAIVESGATAFLIQVTLYNYRKRTEEERRARETAYRRRNAWKAKKLKKKMQKTPSSKKSKAALEKKVVAKKAPKKVTLPKMKSRAAKKAPAKKAVRKR